MKWFREPLLALAGALIAAAGHASGLADLVERVRPSVVAIGTHQTTRSPQAVFKATGFVVDDGRKVVTNFHALPPQLDSAHFERLMVFAGRGRNPDARPARLLASDPAHDLALLAIEGAPLPPLPLASALPREGEEIAFTGLPIGMVLGLYPVTHRGIVSAITPIVIPAPNARQLTPQLIRSMSDPFEVLQLDATAYPGNSGSPVYAIGSGTVVGVINMVFVKSTKEAAISDPSGITYAIPVRYVKRLLEQATTSP